FGLVRAVDGLHELILRSIRNIGQTRTDLLGLKRAGKNQQAQKNQENRNLAHGDLQSKALSGVRYCAAGGPGNAGLPAPKPRVATQPLAKLPLFEQRKNLIQQDAENCQQKKSSRRNPSAAGGKERSASQSGCALS